MATTTYKVLGQVNPTANTISTLYQAPAYVSTVISSITVCNQASTVTTFTIAVRPANASLLSQHYLNYNTSIQPYDTIPITIGLTLATTDVIDVSSTSSNVSFTAFGSEINALPSNNIPTINTLTITDSNYNNLNTTTISISTGSYVKLLGSGFSYNPILYIGTATTSATYISNVEIRAKIPGQQSIGNYYLSLLNGTGVGTVYSPGLTYATDPIFFTPTVDYLLVGGGGAGGGSQSTNARGGGGGAGGFVYGIDQPVSTNITYVITVGAGGTGASAVAGVTGTNSSFTGSSVTIVALAGGGGGGWVPGVSGISGGSGGGGSGANSASGGTSTQFSTYGYGVGYMGGTGTAYINDNTSAGAGGGGAGSKGRDGATPGVGGSGGTGTFTTLISTTLAISLGIGQYITATNAIYFAGGGGGGAGISFGVGGLGGGGSGAPSGGGGTSDLGSSGISYTGGGGGGAGGTATPASGTAAGANGGSGVVILRHPNTYNSATLFSGTTVINTGGYWIYAFKSSGSIRF